MKRKKTRTRTILCVILALVIAMGSVSMVNADIWLVKVGGTRLSNTSAACSTSVEFADFVTSCSVTMILQEKYNDGWRTATDVPSPAVYKSANYTDNIYIGHEYTLVKGRLYRIMAEITEKNGSTSHSIIYYSTLF